MVVYHLHDGEPLFKYLLISFGTTLLLIVFLLMCGKKNKKSSKSNDEVHATYQVSEDNSVILAVDEERIECEHVTEVESTPEGTSLATKAQHSPTTTTTTKTLPNVHDEPPCKPPTTDHRPPTTDHRPPTPRTTAPLTQNIVSMVEICSNEPDNPCASDVRTSSSTTDNPYASVRTKDVGGAPVFECSGNSENSGNSLYAKVQDVAMKEETAYAVVDIKDKDYDFINGELIRRKVEVDDDDETNGSSQTTCHYDKPVSPAKRKLPDEEIENSGNSGIYEVVSECKKNNIDETLNEPSDVDTSDIYDSCGPSRGPPSAPPTPPPAVVPHRDFSHDSTKRLALNPEPTIPRRGSSKETLTETQKSEKLEKVDKNEKCEKSEKHEHEEKHSTRLSKLLKFTHSSRKGKKNEESHCHVDLSSSHVQAVDIPVDNITTTVEGDAPPPLPSVDKLIHISAHRKGQHSLSDINPSPESSLCDSSPAESPLNPTKMMGHPFSHHERKTSDDTVLTSNDNRVLYNQIDKHPPPPPHRPRMSEGDIPNHDVPREMFVKAKSSPLPGNKRTIIGDDVTGTFTERNDHVGLDSPTKFDMDVSTVSLLSEPDYAEIEMRRNSNNQPVVVKESNFELPQGYTSIDYGSRREPRVPEPTQNGSSATVNSEKEGSPTYVITCEATCVENEHVAYENVNANEPSDDPDYVNVPGMGKYENVPGTGKYVTNLDDFEKELSNGECEILRGVEEGTDVDNDYAQIDFSARDEERRVKNLYASIDYSLKKPRGESSRDGAVTSSHPVMYEGTYNVIPDHLKTSEAENNAPLDTVEVTPLYEQVPSAV